MLKSSWFFLPAAFFLLLNFASSEIKYLFIVKLVYFVFFGLLFLFLRKFRLTNIILFSVGGISLIVFIYGIIQKFYLFPYYLKNLEIDSNFYSQALIARVKTGRIFSLFTLPTLYAIICAVLILFIFHYLLNSMKGKIFWALLLGLGVFNLVLTQSFGGILYLALGMLFYLLLTKIINLRYLAPIVMFLSLFFFIVIALRFSEARSLKPLKLRISNWKQAVRMIGTRPLWGVGLGNYQAEISAYVLPGEARSIYAHNFFLQLTAETGILIPFFLVFILICFGKKLKIANMSDKVVYLAALLMILFYNVVDIGFYFFTATLFTVVILSQIYPSYDKKYKFSLVVMVFLTIILVVNSLSKNFQKNADFYLAQKKYNQAEDFYLKSLDWNPLNFNSLMGISYIKYQKNDFLSAEESLNRLLKIFPDYPFANYLLSKVKFIKREYFTSFYHAMLARQRNKLNNRYKRWYEIIKINLQNRINQAGS